MRLFASFSTAVPLLFSLLLTVSLVSATQHSTGGPPLRPPSHPAAATGLADANRALFLSRMHAYIPSAGPDLDAKYLQLYSGSRDNMVYLVDIEAAKIDGIRTGVLPPQEVALIRENLRWKILAEHQQGSWTRLMHPGRPDIGNLVALELFSEHYNAFRNRSQRLNVGIHIPDDDYSQASIKYAKGESLHRVLGWLLHGSAGAATAAPFGVQPHTGLPMGSPQAKAANNGAPSITVPQQTMQHHPAEGAAAHASAGGNPQPQANTSYSWFRNPLSAFSNWRHGARAKRAAAAAAADALPEPALIQFPNRPLTDKEFAALKKRVFFTTGLTYEQSAARSMALALLFKRIEVSGHGGRSLARATDTANLIVKLKAYVDRVLHFRFRSLKPKFTPEVLSISSEVRRACYRSNRGPIGIAGYYSSRIAELSSAEAYALIVDIQNHFGPLVSDSERVVALPCFIPSL